MAEDSGSESQCSVPSHKGMQMHSDAIQSTPAARFFQCFERLGSKLPVILALQAAAPHLAKTKGSIINISSVASYRPESGALAYCVSKAGLDMLTRGTAQDLASKVILCPLSFTSGSPVCIWLYPFFFPSLPFTDPMPHSVLQHFSHLHEAGSSPFWVQVQKFATLCKILRSDR